MMNLMIINASRGSTQKYENLKNKLYKSNANIYFNKQRDLMPTSSPPCTAHIKSCITTF